MENAKSIRKTFDLTGKVAVVTGAGGGIGRATSEVLAGSGATVYCADVNGEAAEETAAAITADEGSAVGRGVDVSDAVQVTALVTEAAEAQGRLDVMCNIAGIMVDGPVLDIAEEDLDRIMAVNLKGVLFGCQAAGPIMVAQGSGSIINMASTAALAPAPDVGAYAMTKAAVIQLTKTLALEVGRKGVRVNAVAPGFVPTNMTSRYYRRPDGTIDEDMKEQVLKPMATFAPLRRVGEPSDIAYCVLYLATEASSFLTGQCLSPNGGMTMH